jgi:hypothetical protein
MPGVMTSSTLGTSEWFCWLHFGKEAVQWQAITVELNHLVWLVEAIYGMRRHYGGPGWPDAYRKAVQSFRVQQRPDLEKLEKETVKQWLLRLDNVLGKAASETSMPPVKQETTAKDNWQKVNFQQPEAA